MGCALCSGEGGGEGNIPAVGYMYFGDSGTNCILPMVRQNVFFSTVGHNCISPTVGIAVFFRQWDMTVFFRQWELL